MPAEKQESGTLSLGSEARGGNGFGQATEALEGLHSVVDQAARAVRDLTQASQQWSQVPQERAREMGRSCAAKANAPSPGCRNRRSNCAARVSEPLPASRSRSSKIP